MFDWAVAGVNVSLPGEGGVECAEYLPLPVRFYESVVILGIALCVFIYSRSNPFFSLILRCQRNGCENYRKLEYHDHGVIEIVEGSEKSTGSDEWKDKLLTNVRKDVEEEDGLAKDNRDISPFIISKDKRQIFESLQERNSKNWLLVLVCLIWGAEIGFKFASRTVIYLLNPCHVVTAVQIYLLAAEPSYQVTVIFRIHLYFLNGAILAFLFPNTESRILPCETSLYWIQHSMMLIVPIYLLCHKGVYNVEPLRDLSWGALSFAINIVYHFAFLQPIALISEVNLNQLLCPAQLDPFRGTYYRTAAVIHQSILCPLVAKACYVCASFLTSSSHANVESTFEHPAQEPNTVNCDSNSCEAELNEPVQKNSITENISCHEKSAGFRSDVNHEIEILKNQVTGLEKVDHNVENPSDKINTSDDTAHDLPFQLRLRKALNEVDEL